jgi:hypothetical protein
MIDFFPPERPNHYTNRIYNFLYERQTENRWFMV